MTKRICMLVVLLLLVNIFVRAEDVYYLQGTSGAPASANGNGNDLPVSDFPSCGLQVTGTFSATLNPEIIIAGKWEPVLARNLKTDEAALTITEEGFYSVTWLGAYRFRCRVSGYSSGSFRVLCIRSKVAAKAAAGAGGAGDIEGVTASSPLTGGGSTGNVTVGIQNAAADGSTKGAAGFAAADFNAASGIISIDYANGQKATGSVPGFLAAADFASFAAKQAALGYTAENVANKATGFGTLNNTLYPTVQAVANYAQPLNQNLSDIAALADPNADRIVFWDDSAGAYKHLTLGQNLSITGTTLDAAAGGGLPAGLDFTSPDFTIATGVANQPVISGASAGNPVKIVAAGSDSNIGITITPKGNKNIVLTLTDDTNGLVFGAVDADHPMLTPMPKTNNFATLALFNATKGQWGSLKLNELYSGTQDVIWKGDNGGWSALNAGANAFVPIKASIYKTSADTTGSGTVVGLGSNCPATTLTAPYTWIKMESADGSTVWLPAYKFILPIGLLGLARRRRCAGTRRR